VASLGLVSPGAATDGVAPIFPEKKLATFFAYHCHFLKNFTRVSPSWRVSRCHPPGGCHPRPFSPVWHRLSTVLCKLSHIFSFGCHPRGVPPRPLMTPLGLTSAPVNFELLNTLAKVRRLPMLSLPRRLFCISTISEWWNILFIQTSQVYMYSFILGWKLTKLWFWWKVTYE